MRAKKNTHTKAEGGGKIKERGWSGVKGWSKLRKK